MELLVAGVSVLTAILIALGLRRDRRDLPPDQRRQSFAARYGLLYVGEDPFNTRNLDLNLFTDRSGPHRVRYVAHGLWRGMPVRVFDLEVSGSFSGMDEGRLYRRHCCAVVEVDSVLPIAVVEPVDLLDRLVRIDRDDVEVGDRNFDRRYRVQGASPERLASVFDDRIRSWISQHAPGIRFELADGVVLASRPWVARPALHQGGLFGEGLGGPLQDPPLEEAVELARRLRLTD